MPLKNECVAIDFIPTPDKLKTILDFCAEHRAWYQDTEWEDKENRRQSASYFIANTFLTGKIWEVWRLHPAELCGILLLRDIVAQTDAKCHFVFFDRKLADKHALCINTMRWCFERLKLHRLSVEIPTYATQLVKFARKLGFRYESEGRTPYKPKQDYLHKYTELRPLNTIGAYVGSRKHQCVLYEGQWHDQLMLSILREEFDEQYGQDSRAETDEQRVDGPGTRVAGTGDRVSPELLPQPPTGDARVAAADLGASTADLRRME